MIYTASYFETQNHWGEVISISLTSPEHWGDIKVLTLLCPTWQMSNYWKAKVAKHSKGALSQEALDMGWVRYTGDYLKILESRRSEIASWLQQHHPKHEHFTLCCWEKSTDPYPQCHRNILGAWIAENFPVYWGGRDEPVRSPQDLAKEQSFLKLPDSGPIAYQLYKDGVPYWVAGYSIFDGSKLHSITGKKGGRVALSVPQIHWDEVLIVGESSPKPIVVPKSRVRHVRDVKRLYDWDEIFG